MNRRRLMVLVALGLIMFSAIPLLGATGYEKHVPAQKREIAQDIDWQTFSKNMNVTTFVSPDGSKEELWHFLNSAEESIYVEIYGINSPYILNLIHELHDAKPSLEMKFLLGWNSLGYYSENDYVANNLTLLGYDVRWTNPDDFTYAHQKFVIIDNETTIVHAGNWAKTSFPEEGNKANREWSIAMTDTDVTDYYRNVFDYDWAAGVVYDAGEHGTGDPLTYTGAGTTYERPFAEAGTFSGNMNVTPIFSPETSLQGILFMINSAQATLDIQIPYFTSVGDEGAVDTIIDAIVAAKERGVTVRIITEEEKDWEEIETVFSEHDIPIVWQDTRWFSANHNKGIIVDGRIVLISSINYSDGSISENREAGVIIENEDVAQWYQEIYDFDWSIGDCDAMDEVNVYWTPNIPSSSAAINVTVYAHMLYGSTIEEVYLDYRIGSGEWNNESITSNAYLSAEEDLENFFYVIPAQSDGTNITVVGRVRVGSTWHVGFPMVIRIRDSIGSASSTTTGTTTTPTPTTDPLIEFLVRNLIYILAGVVAAIIAAVVYKKRR